VLGGLLLVFLAVRGLRQGLIERSAIQELAVPCRLGPTYFQFLGLTIINPLTVIYFTALILGRNAAATQYDIADQLLFVAGAALASLSWQTMLALLGSVAHTRLSGRFRQGAVAFGNLVVFALGLRILLLAGLELSHS